MRAAIFKSEQALSGRPLFIQEVSRPKLKEGHLLLRVLACGVCRTDLHIVDGDIPPLKESLIPGHQIVGESHKNHSLFFEFFVSILCGYFITIYCVLLTFHGTLIIYSYKQ